MDTAVLSYYVFYFTLYSFTGWIIETVYRSVSQRRAVNAGFMHGPVVPIYGFGALVIIAIDNIFREPGILEKAALYFFLLSFIEYLTGLFFEKTLKLKLWDYTENSFNIQGRVCLLYSFFWTASAIVFSMYLHPQVSDAVSRIDREVIYLSSLIAAVYFSADLVFSLFSAAAFRAKLSLLLSDYVSIESFEFDKIMNSMKRLRRAFPHLNRYIKWNIDINLRKKIDGLIDNVHNRVVSRLSGRIPVEQEYLDAVEDILKNREFLKTKNYFHHNSSIYEHAFKVSYLSYSLCKMLNLDYISAARGALLHDFFLYDWRNHDVPDLPRSKFHGFEHPKIALENSENQFNLNNVEKDIILCHMWPLTVKLPRYRESFVVSFADKYASSKEFISEIGKSIKRK